MTYYGEVKRDENGHIVSVGHYKRSEIKGERAAFLDGLETMADVAVNFGADFVTDEGQTVYERLYNEIAEEVLDNLQEWFECELAEALVSFGDELYDERDGEDE